MLNVLAHVVLSLLLHSHVLLRHGAGDGKGAGSFEGWRVRVEVVGGGGVSLLLTRRYVLE